MDTGRLRKRPNGRTNNDDVLVENDDDDDKNATNDIDKVNNNIYATTNVTSTTTRCLRYVYLLFHLMAVICFIFGFIWRGIHLHTGDECDMTYSHRTYVEIDTTTVTASESSFTSSSSSSSDTIMSQYKLYKFVDKRDPRYYSFWNSQQQPKSLTGSQWCTGNVATSSSTSSNHNHNSNTRRIVLYIPGHWGSYEQSRSIGAHGIQLTRARTPPQYTKKIQNLLYESDGRGGDGGSGSNNSSSSSRTIPLHEFIYDVYAVDFNEQGTALHGHFIQAQSEFIIKSIQLLVETCNASSVTIVAHSMGGYSARLAASILNAHQRQHVIHDIITLATPHNNPLYAWEKSIYDIHQRIQQQEDREDISNNNLLIVSLSGGLRDEMIEPNSCNVNNNKDNSNASSSSSSAVTILSSQIIPRGSLGMDHQAIVWCHDVLEVVRELIWILSISEGQTVQDRLHKVEERLLVFRNRKIGGGGGGGSGRSDEDYTDEVEDLEIEFQNIFGNVKAVCMESAMLYNLPVLLSLFAIIGGLNYAVVESVSKDFLFFIPGVACIWGCIWSDLHGFTVLIHTLVASTVHGIVVRGITILSRALCASSLESNRIRKLSISMFLSFLFIQILGVAYSVWCDGDLSFLPLDVATYMAVILLVYVSLFQMVGRREVPSTTFGRVPTGSYYATLLVVTIPFLVAGQVLLIGWERSTRFTSWNVLLQTCSPILAVCYVKRPLVGDSASNQRCHAMLSCFLVVFILFWSPRCLLRGTGFRLTTLIRVISWADLVFASISSKVTPQPATKDDRQCK